jgi:alkylation response protein AidB-like acyl-CoA dehydrogenase
MNGIEIRQVETGGLESVIDCLHSPSSFLKKFLGKDEISRFLMVEELEDYDMWWQEKGESFSESVDKSKTPWLKMYDESGKRIDKIEYISEYWELLYEGYKRGIVDKVFEKGSVKPFYYMLYIITFYDAGLGCPYTVSLSTAIPILKYADEKIKSELLPKMRKRGKDVWQGATWMTEIKGGSDLGFAVETRAYEKDGKWFLDGEKYFASNVGAELAVVAARPEGAPRNVKGLALFLIKKFKENGELNYFIRRLKNKIGTRSVPTGEVELKNSEAYLLGKKEWGIYEILDVLNSSRVSNIFGSVAGIQRAISLAYKFASQRFAFGKNVIDHPLMRAQFDGKVKELKKCFSMAHDAVSLYDQVFKETPPFSDKFNLFRLISHIAKYYTAETAIQTSKWAMEVWGGLGILEEFPVERLFRESIILSIWEGTPHRQMLDGLEVILKKQAHKLLFEYIREKSKHNEFKMAKIKKVEDFTQDFLNLDDNEKEKKVEILFKKLASLWE